MQAMKVNVKQLTVLILVALLALQGSAVGFSSGSSADRRLSSPNMRRKTPQSAVSGFAVKKSRTDDIASEPSKKRTARSTGKASLLPEGFEPEKTDAKPSSTLAQRVLSAEGLANKDDIKVEFGEGHGETSEEALKEAMRDVLQKVVGVYVDSDFRMNNDEIIKDEIIMHSNGFIDHYKKMDEEDDNNGRGKVVTIKAWVKIRDFVNRMKKIAPSHAVKMDGVLIASDVENDLGAEGLINKMFGNIRSLVDLLDVRIEESLRPVVISRTEDVVTLRYVYVIRVSQEKYYQKFVPSIKSVLDQIAVSKRDSSSMSFSVTKIGMYPRVISAVKSSYTKESWKDQPQTAYVLSSPLPYLEDEKKHTVSVMEKINRGGLALVSRWRLSARHMDVFLKKLKEIHERESTYHCSFMLLDRDKEIIAQKTYPIEAGALFRTLEEEETTAPDIMPFLETQGAAPLYFMDESSCRKVSDTHKSGMNMDVVDRFVGYVDIPIEKSDVAKIDSAEIKLETDNQGENE